MSGNLWLDWTILTLSLINIVLMLWLGWMIFLSAEKRTWGVYLAAGGLFAGTLFFTSHAALLGENIALFNLDVNFWWHLGWAPIIAAPFAWYIVMLWFSGYWEAGNTILRVRHRPWMIVTILYAVLLLALLIFLDPLGNLNPTNGLGYDSAAGMTSLPLLYIGYPVFILMCIILSMDALLRPAPSKRRMGEFAREKARPWLAGAGFILLVTAIGVSFTIGWVLTNTRNNDDLPLLYGNIAPTLAWIDLLLSILITSAVILIGQAVVSYEIFTGKPLPRKGFRRQWGGAIVLAVCIATTGSLIYLLQLRQIYLLILTAFLAGSFFALFSWRGSVEREQTIRQLRPFLFSQNLTDIILTTQDLPSLLEELRKPFASLIQEVLGVDKGYLEITGGLAHYYPLRLSFPEQNITLPFSLPLDGDTGAYFPARPLDPDTQDGFAWSIPLWSERGQDGFFLLGKKLDDSFITQEEIEVARAAGERMVDVLISTELAIQLVNLQREKMVDLAISEQRPRRFIHDEILPRLHAVMLGLSASESDKTDVIQELGTIHKDLAGLIREMPASPPGRVEQVGFIPALREAIQREFVDSFNTVNWDVDAHFEDQMSAKKETSREVLFYAAREIIRNAAKYAHPSGDVLVKPTLIHSLSDRSDPGGDH